VGQFGFPALRRNLTGTRFYGGFCGFGHGASQRFRDARSARRPMIAGLSGGFFECDCGWQESFDRSRLPQAGRAKTMPGTRRRSRSLVPEPGLSGWWNGQPGEGQDTGNTSSNQQLTSTAGPLSDPAFQHPHTFEPGRVRSLLGQTASPNRSGVLGTLPTEGQTLKSPPIGHFFRFSLRAGFPQTSA
jgi:hypothetical protein